MDDLVLTNQRYFDGKEWHKIGDGFAAAARRFNNAHCRDRGIAAEQGEGLMDDLVQRLHLLGNFGHDDHSTAHDAADEIERLRAELDLRRKSGSATERLHNICEGIAREADGSEWSREEWERLDAENASLRAQLAEQQDAAAWCDKHKPSGGARGQCVICTGYALSAALSKISYLCGEPNEMGASIYDVDCDEDGVVDRVEAMSAQLAERDRDAHLLREALHEAMHQATEYDGLDMPKIGPQHWYTKAKDALSAIDAAMALHNKINPVV